MQNDWLDIASLLPPLPLDVSRSLLSKTGGDTSGSHTFIPNLVTRKEFDDLVLPKLISSVSPELLKFIQNRVLAVFTIRDKLKKLSKQIDTIVGQGNFSALWLDREAYSSDSMEHRALITEAVIHVYSATALQQIVALLYANDIPMIPYGEGGGYNMGVTPMAPAVTISVRGIDHISEIKSGDKGTSQITVGAGVPFKDLVAYLSNRGYVLRCDPNTPRAATGGIAATGSNGGKKAFEVIRRGRAVTAEGIAVCFSPDAKESQSIHDEPFLLANKFFGVDDSNTILSTMKVLRQRNNHASIDANPKGIVVPLIGMKASANMLAQAASNQSHTAPDLMTPSPHLPLSTFVGAEGTTGFIYEVTFEIEKPKSHLIGARWHFRSVSAAIAATTAIKKDSPEYFEIITGHSIRKFLLTDFPNVFSAEDEAVLILGIEGDSINACQSRYQKMLHMAQISVANLPGAELDFYRNKETNVLSRSGSLEEFEVLIKPREQLPKKLRTKCKTDMEIRTEYLDEVLKIVQRTEPDQSRYPGRNLEKQDVLFGHLTPNHTAIIHWNIGGFDLYDEEQADIAWSYLESVIGQAQNLAPAGDPYGSARFTGEHGVAGKAPFLWLNYIPKNDFERMCRVKDALDPKGLFNPDTLFLKTQISRSLRARLLNTSASYLTQALKNEQNSAESFILQEGLRCTRCNSCKICPVIDAEHEIAKDKARSSKTPVLPSKRNILTFLERMTVVKLTTPVDRQTTVQEMISSALEESKQLLKKCFYCRKCDKACPVDIQIHPLMRAYHALGNVKPAQSQFWAFLYERLMGEDKYKAITFKIFAFFMMLGKPFLWILRKQSWIPDWLKTYAAPPNLSLRHYEVLQHGTKHSPMDNSVNIGKNRIANIDTVYIRYRGCMDTFGNIAATTSVDRYFTDVLGIQIVDIEKKLCCGFPFEADGLHERAKQSQIVSLIEIAKTVNQIVLHSQRQGLVPKFVIFSNCPTCCEAIREMKELAKDPLVRQRVAMASRLPSSFSWAHMEQLAIQDTAEIAVNLHKKLELKFPTPRANSIGLKVPCHNTPLATKAQQELLSYYYNSVYLYDRCCGLSGTGRLKHPKIGTKISEKLFEQIRAEPAPKVVSGCPSCRDGVEMQRKILESKGDSAAEFDVQGIFQSILLDHPGTVSATKW